MPAKKKEAEDAGLFDMPTIEEMELQDFLEEVGPSTSVIHVLRMKPDGSRPQCGKTTMDQIREDPWEFLRTTYGPGKYMLMFRGSDRRIHGGKVLEVEGPAGEQKQNGNGNGNGNGSFNEEKIPFHDRLMMYHMMKPAAPAIDMGAMFMGIAAIMTAMKPAEGAKPVDPLEMVRSVMGMYNDLRQKNERDPLKELREVAGVIKDLTPDGGGKDPDSMWGAVASIGKDFVAKGSEVLGKFADARTPAVMLPAPAPGPNRTFIPAPGAPPPPPAPGPAALPPGLPAGTVMIQPGPAPVPVAGGPAPVVTPGAAPHMTQPAVVSPLQVDQPSAVPAGSAEDNLRRWLTVQVQMLKGKARAGKDVEDWIDYHLDNGEEPGVQAVLYALRQGATYENLVSFDPEIGNDAYLAGWFKALYEGIRNGRWVDGEFFPGLLSGAMDTGGQGGHARNDSPNAPVSAPGQGQAGSPGASAALPDTDIH